jgi:hypothetical protein
MAIPFSNVTFAGPGRYEWVVAVDGKEVGRLPIEVASGIIMGAQTAPPMPPNER